jgi:hypothetical protein
MPRIPDVHLQSVVAEKRGFNPSTPGVDWERYGREVEYRMGQGQMPATPDQVKGVMSGQQGVQPPKAAASTPQMTSRARPVRPPAFPSPPTKEPRRVRIGGFEVRVIEDPRAANRPQRHHHKGQTTSGYYRRNGKLTVAGELERRRRQARKQPRRGDGTFR